MATQHSDGARTPNRVIAVTAFGVLVATGAMLVLAIIVGPSNGDVGEETTEEVPVEDPEGSGFVSVADIAAPTTSPAPSTSAPRPPRDPAEEDGAPQPDTSAPQTDPTGDGIASDDAEPRVPEPPELTVLKGPFAAIDVTREFACGLLIDGRAECWGNNSVGQTEPPDSEFSVIDAGNWASCGLRANGAIECWGIVEDFDFESSEGPFTSFAVGWGVLCAVRFDGVVICSASHVDPYPHKPLWDDVASVTAGAATFCAITTDHEAVCWDELMTQTELESPLNTAAGPDGPYTELFVGQGDDVACGIRRDQSVACWGDTGSVETDIPPGRFSRLAVGVFHACGLRPSGTITCWGDDTHGQNDAPAGEFVDVSVGFFHSCGVRASGGLVCWGSNFERRLPVPRGEFTAVESLEIENCALRIDQSAVCWQQSF